ncbi:hypothetical protein BT93_F1507 [Corymbia citriodora subsp. variegata]|nr:hypothetical protein BT93_F1507 [Corymbia citriodora subsp. variegata]
MGSSTRFRGRYGQLSLYSRFNAVFSPDFCTLVEPDVSVAQCCCVAVDYTCCWFVLITPTFVWL